MSWGAADVTVRFGRHAALDGVSLDVPAGEVTGVVGGDGAGKTTLLRVLAGALAVDGGSVRRPPAPRIGYLASTSGTYPDLSVDENIEFAASAYGLSSAEAARRAAGYLERTGLADVGGRLAGQLSGGMRQKLGVIRALLHRPDLVVLDEPTTGIDPVSRVDLWWLVARAASDGAAVVFATTYLDEAERAGHVLVLDAGRPLATGRPGDILAAMPGMIRTVAERPGGEAARRAWRRRGAWRVWEPQPSPASPPSPRSDGERAGVVDLQDAVTVLAMRAELAGGREAAGGPGAAARSGGAGVATRGSAAAPAAATTGPGQALARGREVVRRFGDFVAVAGVDLDVRAGEVIGLLGANGAGKTTLIRMLLGLLRPSAGDVWLFGEPPSRATRRRLGYVPQSLGLYDDLTPEENLAFGRAAFGEGASLPAALASAAGVPVGRLPLGIQRRLAFAEALGHDPDLLVLDEPTSGVDPLARARLWESVRAAAEAGAGVLVTTHHMEEADECDRLVVMAGGRVVAGGTAAEITADATVVVVESDAWSRAFAALEAAGLPAALVGRTLRVPGSDPPHVERALGDLPARVHEAPATLEERFFELVAASPSVPAAPGRSG